MGVRQRSPWRLVEPWDGVADATVPDGGGAGPDFGFASPGRVVARHVFYNNSAFDGWDGAANAADDRAIAPDKVPMVPRGQNLSFANYTSYSRGLNGVMIDVEGLIPGHPPTVEDLSVRAARRGTDVQNWAAAPAPSVIAVRPGAGVGGSDRITLVWPDGALRRTWVQLSLAPTRRLGLSDWDVSYVGNLVGDSGDAAGPATSASTTAADLWATRQALFNPAAPIDSRYDFNRDGRVTAADVAIQRQALGGSGLTLLRPPPVASAAATTPGDATGGQTIATALLRRTPQRPTADDLAG